MKKLASILLAMGIATLAPLPAVAADYRASVPATAAAAFSVCNEHGVLSRIVSRFDYADDNLLRGDYAIVDFSSIRLTRYEGVTERQLIERTYCQAFANMADSSSRPVFYLVETGMGYAGLVGDNVEFCVSGLDPLRVYGADCSTLR